MGFADVIHGTDDLPLTQGGHSGLPGEGSAAMGALESGPGRGSRTD